jgi:hypothetical protein
MRYLARKSAPLRLKGSTIPFRLTVFDSMMWKWLLNLEIIYIQYQSKVVCRKRLNISNLYKLWEALEKL